MHPLDELFATKMKQAEAERERGDELRRRQEEGRAGLGYRFDKRWEELTEDERRAKIAAAAEVGKVVAEEQKRRAAFRRTVGEAAQAARNEMDAARDSMSMEVFVAAHQRFVALRTLALEMDHEFETNHNGPPVFGLAVGAV